jgi:hypothetical protein
MQAITQITNSLSTFFAEQDSKIADSDFEWAMGRVKAIKEYKDTTDKIDYDVLFSIAGGKTWYNLFYGRNRVMIEEVVRKNAKTIADKRNAKITKKLLDSGVTEVTSAEVSYCVDGFNGVFKFNGNRSVMIESILAGGHSVQRLHQRVLVKFY